MDSHAADLLYGPFLPSKHASSSGHHRVNIQVLHAWLHLECVSHASVLKASSSALAPWISRIQNRRKQLRAEGNRSHDSMDFQHVLNIVVRDHAQM